MLMISRTGLKKVVDILIMLLTAVGGYLGASAANL